MRIKILRYNADCVLNVHLRKGNQMNWFGTLFYDCFVQFIMCEFIFRNQLNLGFRFESEPKMFIFICNGVLVCYTHRNPVNTHGRRMSEQSQCLFVSHYIELRNAHVVIDTGSTSWVGQLCEMWVEICCFTALSRTSSHLSKEDTMAVLYVRYISFYRHRRNSRFVSMFTRRTRCGIKLWGKQTIRKTLWTRARTQYRIYSNGKSKNNGKEIDWTKKKRWNHRRLSEKGVSLRCK